MVCRYEIEYGEAKALLKGMSIAILALGENICVRPGKGLGNVGYRMVNVMDHMTSVISPATKTDPEKYRYLLCFHHVIR